MTLTRKKSLKRSTTPIPRRKPVKKRNPARQAKDWPRKYGSLERVLFVQAMPCLKCHRVPSENAHTENEGKGRKGHHTTVVPLCTDCHTKYDRHHFPFNDDMHRESVKAYAVTVEHAWQQFQQSHITAQASR